MKSLFSIINEWSIEDDFSVHFALINLSKGWDIVNNLHTDNKTKNKVVKYVVNAYSPDSPLFRSKKDRLETKVNIAKSIGLSVNDLVLDIINNKEKTVNDFIWWWIKENKDRDFALRIALEESMFQQFRLASEGIEANIECSSMKETAAALKYFQKMEVAIKGDAMKKGMEMKDKLDSLEKKLEQKFQYLRNVVKNEIPEVVDDDGWAEFEVFSRKQNEN